jgi:lipid II:glycine glycyltransferase (peptidoglycan interpeptide bridge formation enzyme)
MIKRIESEALDLDKLAQIQKLHADDLFCQSAYFEPLFERWCALVLNDYEGVLLVPYKRVGPWVWSFTPLFYRASYWLGTWTESDKKEALQLLKKSFHFGSLNLGLVSDSVEMRIHQVILPQNYTLENYNKLAQRMIRKAQQHDIQLVQDFDAAPFVAFLHRELNEKVAGINSDSMRVFEKLLRSLENKGFLRFEGAAIGGVLVAGILIVEGQGRHLYLKGTATQDAKKIGVYYWLMHRAIERAQAQGAIFDFGGSSIEGVAQFNRNFGAQDAEYGHFSWGKQPRLFKFIKRLKGLWK